MILSLPFVSACRRCRLWGAVWLRRLPWAADPSLPNEQLARIHFQNEGVTFKQELRLRTRSMRHAYVSAFERKTGVHLRTNRDPCVLWSVRRRDCTNLPICKRLLAVSALFPRRHVLRSRHCLKRRYLRRRVIGTRGASPISPRVVRMLVCTCYDAATLTYIDSSSHCKALTFYVRYNKRS